MSSVCLNSVLNVKALVGAFNQEKALVGAFSVIVQPVVEPMDRFATLIEILALTSLLAERHPGPLRGGGGGGGGGGGLLAPHSRRLRPVAVVHAPPVKPAADM